MSKINTIEDIDYAGKRVYLRVDYNVVENGKIIDEFRIKQSLPTINKLLASKCSIILASHNGRPDGKPDEMLSLRPVAQALSNLLNKKVGFVDDCVGEEVSQEAHSMKAGELLLLENLRFHEAEEKNNSLFAKSMANLADVYIDDAFANAHRAHASMVGVPKYLPHAAGLLMEKEYNNLNNLLLSPKRPFVAIVGGAKISTKIEFLKSLLKKADTIFIGGAMANTFLQAQGYYIGASMTEVDCIDIAKDVMKIAKDNNVNLIIPKDLVVAKSIEAGVDCRTVSIDNIQKDDIALDIGKETMRDLIPIIKKAKTIFWNGTLGYAEINEFAWASKDLAHLMSLRKNKADTIIGGGDTTAFIEKLGMHNRFSFVSTGGGASLELLSGKKLAAIEALRS
ncbi:MAG: phosphoglycerate kinase [Candidatus Saccharibacteria bacterium]